MPDFGGSDQPVARAPRCAGWLTAQAQCAHCREALATKRLVSTMSSTYLPRGERHRAAGLVCEGDSEKNEPRGGRRSGLNEGGRRRTCEHPFGRLHDPPLPRVIIEEQPARDRACSGEN